MAINPIGMAAVLRPWHMAGISHFLGDVLGEYTPETEPESGGYGTEDTAPQNALRREGASETLSRAVPLKDAPAVASGSGATGNVFAAPSAGGSAVASSASILPEAAANVRQTGAEEAPRARPWPEPWEGLAARMKPAPLVWTYFELGHDLLCAGDKQRSACLRAMISRLHLPKGSSGFWPVCVPAPDAGGRPGLEEGQGPFFRYGLALLRPQAVVLLGESAVEASGLPLTLRTPFTQQILGGRIYLLLPGIAAVAGDGAVLDKACVYLRSALNSLPVFAAR